MRLVDEIEIDVKTGFFFYLYCNKHDNLTIYIRDGKVQYRKKNFQALNKFLRKFVTLDFIDLEHSTQLLLSHTETDSKYIPRAGLDVQYIYRLSPLIRVIQLYTSINRNYLGNIAYIVNISQCSVVTL